MLSCCRVYSYSVRCVMEVVYTPSIPFGFKQNKKGKGLFRAIRTRVFLSLLPKSLKLNINCNLSKIHVHKLFNTVMLSCMFYISRFLEFRNTRVHNTHTEHNVLSFSHSFQYPPTFFGSESQRLARYKFSKKMLPYPFFRTLCIVYLILITILLYLGQCLDPMGGNSLSFPFAYINM